MVVSSLTSSRHWDIGENYLNWTLKLNWKLLKLNTSYLRPNSGLSQKQINLVMYLQWYNRLVTATSRQMNNLELIILDYLAAKKSRILDWRRDFCNWSVSQGRIQPVSLGGGDFSKIWLSSIIAGSLLQERWSILHNTAVTKQWAAKWPYTGNAVFRIVQNHGEKSCFRRFSVGRLPQSLPSGSALP